MFIHITLLSELLDIPKYKEIVDSVKASVVQELPKTFNNNKSFIPMLEHNTFMITSCNNYCSYDRKRPVPEDLLSCLPW